MSSSIEKKYKYKYKVRKAINTDPHIYNMLVDAFQGGYTHANWIYTDEVIENVVSNEAVDTTTANDANAENVISE